MSVPRILTGFVAVCVICAGCRSDSGMTPTPGGLLNAPTVFIPVGLLKSPRGIAVDNTGDIWIGDTYGGVIRRFTSQGSQRLSLPNYAFPRNMGIDKGTGHVLAIVNDNTILSINPANNVDSPVASLTTFTVDTSGIFDVTTGDQVSRVMNIGRVGDVDGAINGDLFASVVANGGENFLVRVRNGQPKAIAYSPRVPTNTPDRRPRFVITGGASTVYTSFLASTTSTLPQRCYGLITASLISSRFFDGAYVTANAPGGGYDPSGFLFIADADNRELVIVSLSSEQIVEHDLLPDISGMTQPSPADVAVAPDGTVYVVVTDAFDTANSIGAVLRYTRTPVQ